MKKNTTPIILPESLIIHAEKSGYIIFGILSMILPLILLISGGFSRFIDFIIIGGWVIIFLYLIFCLWLWSFKLTINQEEITYKTLFSFKTTIKITDISSFNYSVFDYSDGNGLKPPFRIEVNYNNNDKEKILTINMKPFAASELQMFHQMLLSYGIKEIGRKSRSSRIPIK